ncbi:MAG TPA: DUF1566 domain-containing protein [Pseudoxanthomonas sp.]|nr:DUF1566 domain-containing protein [Pseudoxanthomonas sp.]
MTKLAIRVTDHTTGFDQTIAVSVPANDSASITQTLSFSSEQPSALEWSDTLCGGERVNHAAAVKACADLGADWRLPTDHELLSIVDRSRYNPAIDTDKFPDTKSGAYWTSTLHASDSSYAWVVNFYNGYANAYCHRDGNNAFVRAVRSVPAGQ